MRVLLSTKLFAKRSLLKQGQLHYRWLQVCPVDGEAHAIFPTLGVQLLSQQFEIFTFDFDGDDIKPETHNLSVPIIQSGTCHAIVFWFGLWLDDEIYSERYRGFGGVAPKKGWNPFTPSIKPVLN